MGGSSTNKECALIKCKTKEQQKKKIVAPGTCTLSVPDLLCTSSSNAPLALYLSTFCCCLCPSLAHRFTFFTLSLAGSWCDEFFWFFFFAMVNFPFGKRCVKTLQKQISLFVWTSKYLNWMSFYTIVPMSFGA